jgi:hypothetical protein
MEYLPLAGFYIARFCSRILVFRKVVDRLACRIEAVLEEEEACLAVAADLEPICVCYGFELVGGTRGLAGRERHDGHDVLWCEGMLVSRLPCVAVLVDERSRSRPAAR